MKHLAAAICVTVWISSACYAGEYNPTLSIGDVAPEWKQLPGTDGKSHSFADLADQDVVVVVFTCNTCPYAVDVEDRLIEFCKQKQDNVALVAINVNKVQGDLLPAMQERAKSKSFNFPYLFDETQKIAKDYGATRTPEFFVLNKDRKVVYMGAMDDSSDGKNITKNYLRDAVAAALSGEKPPVTETPPVGCGIRFERTRRSR